MQSTCALPTKTVQWTRGGGTAASSVAFRSVWQWEWSKKVRPYRVGETGTLLMKDELCAKCHWNLSVSVFVSSIVVRTDSLKGRRGRLPSKPKILPETSPTAVPSVNIVASLVRAHLDSNPTNEKLDYSKVNIKRHHKIAENSRKPIGGDYFQ